MRAGFAEFRRTLSVVFLALSALLSFFPFVWNLLLSLFLGGRFRRRVRELMVAGGEAPVDEPSGPGSGGRVYFLAGEDSGDLHASTLAAAIREIAPDVELRGMGGPRLEAQGCRLDYDLVRLNVMGVVPVLKAVGTFFGLFRDALRMLDTDPPDVLVPVDYPGFNLRVARAARRRGVRVVYYIAPQVWAWAPWRLRRIARSVDRMIVILPFERDLFGRAGVPSAFVGHPLYEFLEQEMPAGKRLPGEGGVRRIGLLPGSRSGEVRGVLPQMLRAAREVARAEPSMEFTIPYRGVTVGAEIRAVLRREGRGLPIRLVEGRTHEVMRGLDLALVASGTASLELAYYRVPMVVLYRIGRLSALLKGFALITPHVALVNIVAGRRVVPEYVGPGDYAGRAAGDLIGWIRDEGRRRECVTELGGVRKRLSFEGVSDRAARWVLAGLPRHTRR